MKKFAIVALLVALSGVGVAGTIPVRSGSFKYHDPFTLWIKSDPQIVNLVGGRGFTFTGTIDIFQLNAASCQSAVPYYSTCATYLPVAFATGGSISGYTYPGYGFIGTATLDGVTYSHVGLPNSIERLYLYGPDPWAKLLIPPVSPTANRSVSFPLVGFFHHNGIAENITGTVRASVVFENYQGKMVAEKIRYDIYVP